MQLVKFSDFVEFRPDEKFEIPVLGTARSQLTLRCYEPGQDTELHRHLDHDEYFVVLEGEGLMTIDDETRRIGPGMAVCRPANAIHGLENTGPDRMIVIAFTAPGHLPGVLC